MLSPNINKNDLELYKAAILHQDIPAIEPLLGKGANPHAQIMTDGSTIIDLVIQEAGFKAIKKAKKIYSETSITILELLLKNQTAFPNALYDSPLRKDLHTPLCQATQRKKNTNIALLLQQEANPSSCTYPNCKGPLYQAIEWRNLPAVELLLEKGYDPNTQNKNGSTALHIAATIGGKGIVELLLQHNANPNARDANQNTPLHSAANQLNAYASSNSPVINTQIKIIMLLLEKGAFYHLKNKDEQHAIELLPSAYQTVIQEKYGYLKEKIIQQLNLDLPLTNQEGLDIDRLTKNQQSLVAEQWRRLGEKQQFLVCFLLGVLPPGTSENKYGKYIDKIIMRWLPKSITDLLIQKYSLTHNTLDEFRDFYDLLRIFQNSSEDIKHLILIAQLQGGFSTTIAPLLSTEAEINVEAFVSILLKYLPKACNRYSETLLPVFEEKTTVKVENENNDQEPTFSSALRRP